MSDRRRADAYAGAVAYDEDLAQRIRALVATQPGLSEKKMFGGLAFLVGGQPGHRRQRPGRHPGPRRPGDSRSSLVATTRATVAVMRGRPMAGWLRVGAEDVRTGRSSRSGSTLGISYARSLPAKRLAPLVAGTAEAR